MITTALASGLVLLTLLHARRYGMIGILLEVCSLGSHVITQQMCMHADSLNIGGINTGSTIQYTRGNCTVRKVPPLSTALCEHLALML